jgi:plastocyanin
MLLLACLVWAGPLAAQRTQVIRLTQSPDGTLFRFSPGRVTVKPGDLVEFRAERGAPFEVAFEPADLDPKGRSLIAGALSRPPGELRGPVLADSGSRFRLMVPSLAPGTYRFFCLVHLSYRMGGILVVE